jgi:osmotically inducible lipoprotein OsmB
MKYTIVLCVAAPLALAACSDLNLTEQRTLTGGAGGAAAGAILGAIGGNAGLGAAAGAGAGLLGGYLYDQYKKSQGPTYPQGYSE